MEGFIRVIALLVGVALFVVTGVPPTAAVGPVVAAAPSSARRIPAPDGQRLAPMMLVLDASGSMVEPAAGGTKMDAAKQAVRSVTDTVPVNARLGLTIYGTGTGNSPAEKAAGCKDIEIVQRVGPLDKEGFIQSVNAASPRGYTPIGQSLRTAADALPKEGPRAIVLVSDGEDTCGPPDPCEVARQLARDGVDLRVHTVGFQVGGTAKKQLTCIAQTTGGTYTNVPDAGELTQVLSRLTVSAMRNYQPTGSQVTGSHEAGNAPVIKPGAHLDTLGFVRKRYYSLDVPQGHTAYFAATVPFQRGGQREVEGLNVANLGIGGSAACGNENSVTSSGDDGAALSASLSWRAGPGNGSYQAECSRGGRYTFAVYFTNATDEGSVIDDQQERLPVELQVGLEPPVSGDKGPGPAARPVSFTAPAGPERPISGGGSFGTAATIPGTGRYTESIRYGEFLFYRVRLQWGQGLTYKVHFGAPTTGGSPVIGSTCYSPARAPVRSESTAHFGGPNTLPTTEGDAFATLPIRYRNRESGEPEKAVQGMAGWFYIAVQLGRAEKTGGSAFAPPVSLSLDVTVTGNSEKGPQYAGTTGDQDTFGGPEPGAAPDTRSADGPAGSWWLVGGAVGALVSLCSGAVLLILLRRRRGRGTPLPSGGPEPHGFPPVPPGTDWPPSSPHNFK